MKKGALWILCCFTIGFGQGVHAGQLYRFTVDGSVTIKDHVPAEFSHLGYDVLNSRGMVIDRVPPAPTAEEIAARRAQEAAAQARRDAIALQRQTDLDLLRLYAKPEDVERVRQRKVTEVESYVQLQRRRITDLEEKLERSQTNAANYERRGQTVPSDLRVEIVQLQSGIRDAHNNIRLRREEMQTSTQDYARDFERLRVLQVYPAGTLEDEVDYDLVEQRLK
ncbi:MAG: DUF4124 domain-containing protein [Bacterioplanes sp.]|nr:DUF4124 domain-containing protein [Bacterioplanes sp.]